MSRFQVRLTGPRQREFFCAQAMRAPDGHFGTIAPPTRTLEQNAKLHPMIADVRRQVPDMQRFSSENAKLRFLNALGTEMRWLPDLENEGTFPVGLRSSLLTVGQFSLLVDLIYEYGARHDVRWSEPVERIAA